MRPNLAFPVALALVLLLAVPGPAADGEKVSIAGFETLLGDPLG